MSTTFWLWISIFTCEDSTKAKYWCTSQVYCTCDVASLHFPSKGAGYSRAGLWHSMLFLWPIWYDPNQNQVANIDTKNWKKKKRVQFRYYRPHEPTFYNWLYISYMKRIWNLLKLIIYCIKFVWNKKKKNMLILMVYLSNNNNYYYSFINIILLFI